MSKLNVKELDEAKARVLKWLPTAEREVADRIIFKAVKLGFTNISLWPLLDPDSDTPSVKDLVGNDSNGTLYFLYGKI
jgi:hypothetical protein